MSYYWRVKKYLPERYKMPCKVLLRSEMNSCLVEFPDGYKVVTSRNFVRKTDEWKAWEEAIKVNCERNAD